MGHTADRTFIRWKDIGHTTGRLYPIWLDCIGHTAGTVYCVDSYRDYIGLKWYRAHLRLSLYMIEMVRGTIPAKYSIVWRSHKIPKPSPGWDHNQQEIQWFQGHTGSKNLHLILRSLRFPQPSPGRDLNLLHAVSSLFPNHWRQEMFFSGECRGRWLQPVALVKPGRLSALWAVSYDVACPANESCSRILETFISTGFFTTIMAP